MPLSEFKPRKIEITFDGGSLEVRAISLPDVAILIDSHEYQISHVVEMVRSRKDLLAKFYSGSSHTEQESEALAEIIRDTLMEIIRTSPTMIANIIALCADEPGQIESATRLPFPTQVEALTAIGQLTFKDIASVKKFAADVNNLIRSILPSETETLAA